MLRVPYIFFLCANVALAVSLSAAVIDWDGGSSGNFSDGSSWDGGVVPGTADTANFATAGAVTVTLTVGVAIDNLTFNGTADPGPPVVPPQLTIELNGFQLSSGLQTDALKALSLGNTGTEERTFSVLGNGTFNVNHRLLVHEFQIGATGNLASSGFNLVLDNAAVIRGNRNTGHLLGQGDSIVSIEVRGGSSLDLNGRTVIAGGADATTSILVTGTGSTFINSNSGSIRYHNFGTTGTAVMTVEQGGRYESNAYSSLGLSASGSGEIYVTGSSSTFEMARGLYVGGGLTNDDQTPSAGGSGLFSLADNATATVGLLQTFAADVDAGRFGQVILDGTVSMTATDAILASGSVLRMGLRDTAQLPNLTVVEELTLNGATLEAWLPTGLTPQIGQSFALIEYGALFGLFGNPDGEVIIDGHVFQIDYALGGQDVIGLTVIPEPGLAALVFGCAAFFVVRRLRKSGS